MARGRVCVLECDSGYGKSLLIAQFARELSMPTAVAPLPPSADAAAIIATLGRALRAANLSDLAAALQHGDGDPRSRIDALIEALGATGEPVLLAIDDAHHALGGGAAELLVRVCAGLPEPHRAVIAAQELPGPLARVRTIPGVALLETPLLAFNQVETEELLERAGVDPVLGVARELREATDGWPAALVMAISTIARSEDQSEAADSVLETDTAPAAQLDELLLDLVEIERQTLIQLAHLPLISPAIADQIAGHEETFDRLVAAGAPLARTAAGWWELPEPVVQSLIERERLQPDAARDAAYAYAAAGESGAALKTLIAGADPDGAAALLASLQPQEVEELGCRDAAEIVGDLPEDVVVRHPRVLLQLARVAEATYQSDLRDTALARLDGMALSQLEQSEFDAERARELLWVHDTRGDASSLAQSVLARVGDNATVARARALDALGRAYCAMPADERRERARPLLEESARISRALGARTWAAQALISLGRGVHFAQARYDDALRTLDEALSELPARSRYRAVVESFRADVLTELGRPVEAERSIEQMREIGSIFAAPWALAFASWAEARVASYGGDRARTVAAVTDAERHRDEWYERVGGLEFLAHAADLVDRVGEHELALRYLERAQARAGRFDRPVRLFRASVAARSGDPDRAEQLIGELFGRPELELQERWWLELLRAHAAHRRGDEHAGSLAGVAFDRCLELGYPAAPLIREPTVTEALIRAAAAAGSRSAARLQSGAGQLSVKLLGDLEVRRGATRLDLPFGRPATAVGLVAAHGGRMQIQELKQLLWPRAKPDVARNRLRSVLSRLQASAGPVLVRDGDDILLAADSDVDAARFQLEAEEVLALKTAGERERAAVLARGALGRYHGDLLATDAADKWAAGPRERLRALYVELLDLAADDAERREEFDEAMRLLRRAIDTAPHDESRYLRLARLRASQGRIGSARSLLRRGRAALTEVGLQTSPEFDVLAQSLADASAAWTQRVG
jgi:DNA-binding SARP family transcriptional activator/ATP/maltotriose-dependent transcriptional regulator MalT